MPMELTLKNQNKSVPFGATGAGEPCNVLGRYPATAVSALADLGLTDQEIARYFRVQAERITQLRVNTAPELQMTRKGNAGTTPAGEWNITPASFLGPPR